jgi:hypothetical protein
VTSNYFEVSDDTLSGTSEDGTGTLFPLSVIFRRVYVAVVEEQFDIAALEFLQPPLTETMSPITENAL